MRRLAAFSTLPREGPSVRPRVLAYGPSLREAGIDLRLLPFLSSRGFSGFYETGLFPRARKAAHAAAGLLRRLGELSRDAGFGGALVHREILPRGNRHAVRALGRRGLRLAYDLDDAIYLSPREYVDPSDIKPRDLDDVRPGGLGVHIIVECMDEVTYSPRDGGGTVLTMVKNLRPADAQESKEVSS